MLAFNFCDRRSRSDLSALLSALILFKWFLTFNKGSVLFKVTCDAVNITTLCVTFLNLLVLDYFFNLDEYVEISLVSNLYTRLCYLKNF